MRRGTFIQLAGTALVAPVGAPFPMQPMLQQLSLGVSVPLSGTLAPYGNQIVQGVQAAIDETNRFTSLTRVFGIRTFDDRNQSAVATSNVLVAQADPSIVGMIGNLTADVTLSALPAYSNASFALVVPSVTADALTARGFRNVFRLPTKDSSEGQLFAQAVLGKVAPLRAVALTVDGEFGFDVAQGFVAQAKVDKHDADILTLGATASAADSAAIVLKRNPAYVFLSGRPEKLGPVAAEMRAQSYAGQFGAGDGFFTPSTTDTYGNPLDGALVASSMPPLDKAPSVVSYLQDFRNDVSAVTVFTAYGYAAAQLLIQAAQRSSATNRFQLLTQLQEGGLYDLLVGQYTFTFAGDATMPNIYLYRAAPSGFTFAQPAVASGFIA
jgi:branched-chain amino acid transport system substrate-binding protein